MNGAFFYSTIPDPKQPHWITGPGVKYAVLYIKKYLTGFKFPKLFFSPVNNKK